VDHLKKVNTLNQGVGRGEQMKIGCNSKRGAVVSDAKKYRVGIGLCKPTKRSFEIAMNKVEFQNAS